jgi:signal transduction histidine kinase
MYALDRRTENRIIRAIYLTLTAGFVYSACRFSGRLWTLSLLVGFLAMSFVVRHMILSTGDGSRSVYWPAYLIDIVLTFFIGRFVCRDAAVIFYLILLCDACLMCPRPLGYVVSGLCFLSVSLDMLLGLPVGQEGKPVFDISVTAGLFLAASAIASIARLEMETRRDHDSMLYALKTKSKQLEDAYAKLRETAKLREEMTAYKERTRIAKEMHDTVGHALTTSLFSLEAGERLLSQDKDQAVQSIALAKAQVRKGLTELRHAVHDMGAEGDASFAARLQALLQEARNGGIFIRESVSDFPELSEQKQTALLRALQEGLTNGLKHGGSTAFVFTLRIEGNILHFSLMDNGKGTGKIVPGFGLKAMNQRVSAAGGSLTVTSEAGEGFLIDIAMPWED